MGMKKQSRDSAHGRASALTPAMRWTLAGVSLVTAAGIVSAVGMLASRPGDVTGAPASSASAATAWDDPASAEPRSDPATADGHDDALPPTPGAVPGAPRVEGSEVLPPEPGDVPNDRVPPLPPRRPLVTSPLPADGHLQGALVTGFPTAVAGPVSPAEVIDSAITAEDVTMQATLTARTELSPGDVRAHYGALWASLGLAPSSDPAATSYSDEYSAITLAFAPTSGTGTVYTVYAVLRTE